jgi:tetratricopeptide (TPR) repeat protein
LYQRGKVRMAMQHYTEAINDLDHAARIKEDHPQVHKLLGDCYSLIGEEEKAAIYWALAEELQKRKG